MSGIWFKLLCIMLFQYTELDGFRRHIQETADGCITIRTWNGKILKVESDAESSTTAFFFEVDISTRLVITTSGDVDVIVYGQCFGKCDDHFVADGFVEVDDVLQPGFVYEFVFINYGLSETRMRLGAKRARRNNARHPG